MSSPKNISVSWYRGQHCNFLPNRPEIADPDKAIELTVQGWVPEKPFITKKDRIVAFGSCFATHIQTYLRKWGYNIPGKETCNLTRAGAGLVNTYTVLQQFQWVYEDRNFPEDVWFDEPGIAFRKGARNKEATRKLLDSVDLYIITLGLSEVWCDKKTGNVFWRAVPKNVFDPKKHEFRVTTCEENKQNLKKLIKIIRKQRPQSSIVFTLSPVPLRATFRPVSCVTASCVSKSILRTALDETLREVDTTNIYYWPSYEIVKELHIDAYKQDNTHIYQEVVKKIMRNFEKYYLIK